MHELAQRGWRIHLHVISERSLEGILFRDENRPDAGMSRCKHLQQYAPRRPERSIKGKLARKQRRCLQGFDLRCCNQIRKREGQVVMRALFAQVSGRKGKDDSAVRGFWRLEPGMAYGG